MENDTHQNNNRANNQLITSSVDLLAPSDRFEATSRLFVRLHRHQLLLAKYWWVLVLLLLFTVLPAYFLTMGRARAYQSDARMWLTGKLDLSEGRLYTEELVNFLGTQADLLRSRGVQGRALANVQQQFSNAPPIKPVAGTLDILKRLVRSSRKNSEAFQFWLKV